MSAEKRAITGHTADRVQPSGALWLGPGALFQDLAPVLDALAAASPGARPAVESLPDLDRLFEPAPASGRLLVDDGALALEDVGLLRRFLRRHPGWQLVLCGEDPRERTARALTGEDRTRWLAWPPDLDQLRWLASAGPAPEASSNGGVPAAAAPAARGLDLGELLEESLASAALLGDDPPRFAYRSEGGLRVELAEPEVSPLVDGLLTIARACADGAEISVVARGRDSEVAVELTFPEGPLSRLPAKAALTPDTLAAEIGDEAGVAALELSSGLEAARGARLDASREGGSVRLRLVLPSGA